MEFSMSREIFCVKMSIEKAHHAGVDFVERNDGDAFLQAAIAEELLACLFVLNHQLRFQF